MANVNIQLKKQWEFPPGCCLDLKSYCRANRARAVTIQHRDLLTHPDVPEKCLKIISHEYFQLLNVSEQSSHDHFAATHLRR